MGQIENANSGSVVSDLQRISHAKKGEEKKDKFVLYVVHSYTKYRALTDSQKENET